MLMTCSVVRVILMFTWLYADYFTIHMSHVPSSSGLAVDNIYSILNSDLDKSENEVSKARSLTTRENHSIFTTLPHQQLMSSGTVVYR